ncbi:hypothetical protein VSDG_02966 [Cytospora chrysosperma]|uniref:Uncharacterized protein n=1 Tax=Cytospora chrysosperma TaxID=252740 RepID=A0A423W8M3_CYTCH|nr:hypothetical protein VSDG_02966 [Valsa sordida]
MAYLPPLGGNILMISPTMTAKTPPTLPTPSNNSSVVTTMSPSGSNTLAETLVGTQAVEA